ncbi:MAG: hypothetical protein WCX97_00140 [Candidatus Magasanikbacteria bacterium]
MSYLTIDLNAGHPSFHSGTIKRTLSDNDYAPLSRNWRVFYSDDNFSGLMLFTSYWGWAERDGVPMPVVIDIGEGTVRENHTENKETQEIWDELGRGCIKPP